MKTKYYVYHENKVYYCTKVSEFIKMVKEIYPYGKYITFYSYYRESVNGRKSYIYSNKPTEYKISVAPGNKDDWNNVGKFRNNCNIYCHNADRKSDIVHVIESSFSTDEKVTYKNISKYKKDLLYYTMELLFKYMNTSSKLFAKTLCTM